MTETKQSVWVLSERVSGPSGRSQRLLRIFGDIPSKDMLMKYIHLDSEKDVSVIVDKLLENGSGFYSYTYYVEEEDDDWEDSVVVTLREVQVEDQ